MKKRKNLPNGIEVNQSTFGIVNLNTYTSPDIVEVASKNWVAYGEYNDYFQYLIDR